MNNPTYEQLVSEWYANMQSSAWDAAPTEGELLSIGEQADKRIKELEDKVYCLETEVKAARKGIFELYWATVNA